VSSSFIVTVTNKLLLFNELICEDLDNDFSSFVNNLQYLMNFKLCIKGVNIHQNINKSFTHIKKSIKRIDANLRLY